MARRSRSGSSPRRRSRSKHRGRSESGLQRWLRKNRQRGLSLLVVVLAVLGALVVFVKQTSDSSVDAPPADVQ